MAIQQLPVSTSPAPRTTVVYATAGTYTFTPPAGTSASNPLIADVVVVGGGGGGGGATSVLTGASGSAAQVVSQTSVPVTSAITITVGAGGTGGASNGGTGGNGGTSTFGSYFTALGGNGAAGNTPGAAVSLMPSTTAGTSGVSFFANGMVYSSSTTSYLYTSDTATSVTSTSALPYSLSANGMAYGNSLLVGCSSSFAFYSSNQGATWTSVPKTGGSDYNLRYLNGTFFHMSSGSTYSTSPDGMTWTARTAPEGWFMDIAWSGSAYAVATNGGNIYSSTDGINWTSRATPGFNFLGIGWAGGSINKFYAVGNGGSTSQTYYTATSNGVSWSSATFGTAASWMQTFYDVNTARFYVMCGDQGTHGTSLYTTNGTSFTAEGFSGESGMSVKFTTAHNNGWSLGGANGSGQSRVFTHNTSGTRTKIDTQSTISAIQGGTYAPSATTVGGRVPGVTNALTGFFPGAGASGSVSGGSGGLYTSTLLTVAASSGTTAAGSGRVPGAGGGGGGTAAQTGGAGGVGAVYITY